MDGMDVLWSKERLHKIFSKDCIRVDTAQASGDGVSPLRCCRLCGDDGSLKCFCDTYLWEGVEERYDELLYNCFGIQAPSRDAMICERCVHQLRNTQRFRALVRSAFERPVSEYSSNNSQLGTGEGLGQMKVKSKTVLSRFDLSKKATRTGLGLNLKRNRGDRKKNSTNSKVQVKRMNIACTVCTQKYPMLVPLDGCKNFVCSRCKKTGRSSTSFRKVNATVPVNMAKNHSELHAKTNLRGRSRLFSVQKIPSQSVKTTVHSKTKYQCKQCTKNYSVQEHLTLHSNLVHKNMHGTVCVCKICEKDFKTKEMLDRHMRKHTGQPMYQCDVCARVFKGKTSFQTHYLTHEK